MFFLREDECALLNQPRAPNSRIKLIYCKLEVDSVPPTTKQQNGFVTLGEYTRNVCIHSRMVATFSLCGKSITSPTKATFVQKTLIPFDIFISFVYYHF